jgi:hypothetical protein
LSALRKQRHIALPVDLALLDAYTKQFTWDAIITGYYDACDDGDKNLVAQYAWYMKDKLKQCEGES